MGDVAALAWDSPAPQGDGRGCTETQRCSQASPASRVSVGCAWTQRQGSARWALRSQGIRPTCRASPRCCSLPAAQPHLEEEPAADSHASQAAPTDQQSAQRTKFILSEPLLPKQTSIPGLGRPDTSRPARSPAPEVLPVPKARLHSPPPQLRLRSLGA